LLDGIARWEGEPLDLVQRVDLSADGLVLTLSLDTLAGEAGLTITRLVPMTIRRRGVEMRFVINGAGAATAKADPALMKAITRARAWFDDIVIGRATSLTALAQRDGINDSYVRNLMPLAFLAPTIVEAIAAGRQPADLTTEALVKRVQLPLGWDDQSASLGFA